MAGVVVMLVLQSVFAVPVHDSMCTVVVGPVR
jgi:hypothetical protein